MHHGFPMRLRIEEVMGSVQLPKLRGFVETRRDNRAWLARALGQLNDFLDFQEETPKAKSSWFGFALRVRENAPFTVAELRAALHAAQIETRPIICGWIEQR